MKSKEQGNESNGDKKQNISKEFKIALSAMMSDEEYKTIEDKFLGN